MPKLMIYPGDHGWTYMPREQKSGFGKEVQGMESFQKKITFQGIILSVQPRSAVWRYRLDNRTHRVTGFNLFLRGTADGKEKDFSVAISGLQQMKQHFHIGEMISGTAWTKKYPETEYADYYRSGAMKKQTEVLPMQESVGTPWTDEVPDLETYDWRGCRMLDKRCWKGKCFQCKWAAMANVTIEWDFGVRQKFRFETFCYGPKNCKNYSMGRPRAVPDKVLGSVYDNGWMDDLCTERRGDEE